MLKRSFTWWACWMIGVWALVSCKSGDEYEAALPKDAALVVSVNAASIVEKSGLSGKEGEALVQRLGDALKSGMQGSEPLVDKIMADPAESGIDFRKNIYLYVESHSVSAGVLARVSDAGKLEALFESLSKQQICGDLVQEDGYEWAAMGNLLVAYTSDALLILGDPNGGVPQDLCHTASMLLRQGEEDGYCATSDFKHIKGGKGDIVALTSLDMLPGQYVSPILMGASGGLELKDIKTLAEVTFAQGKMSIDFTNLSTDKVMKQMQEKQAQAFGKIEGTYLDKFPANTGFWMSMNIDGKKIYEILCGHPLLNSQLENSMMPIDFESIFGSMKGDVAIAGNPMSGKFIAYADVTNARFLQTFENLKPLLALTGNRMQLINRGATGYEFRMTDGSMLGMRPGYHNWWFGVSDGRFYLTNHAEWIDAFVPGQTLRDCPWGKQVKGNIVYWGMNLASAIEEAGQAYGSHAEWNQALGFLQGLDYMTFAMEDMNKSHLELVMKDQDRNILQALLSAIN